MSSQTVPCSAAEGVERDDDQHGVAGDRIELAVGQEGVVVDVVEPDGAQLAQRRVELGESR